MLTFAAPAFLWALLTLPLVVWLHLGRRRRRPRRVAGLFLWERAREAASQRPRPRPTWSLLLQLLAVAALSLALAGPQWQRPGAPDRVLVVDASASMMAVDPDGRRLDKAREAARELVADGGRVALVRMGREARVLQPATADVAPVREALDALRAGDDRADTGRALALARALAGEAGEIHWFSDAPPPSEAGAVTVHDVAGAGRNVGIVAFDASFGQAYVALASNYPGPQTVQVDLLRDGGVVASTETLVPADGRVGTSFPVDAETGVLEARVTAPEGDALALDDRAWAGARRTSVTLQEPFPALERALNAVPGTTVRVTSLAASAPADLRFLSDPGPASAAPDGASVLLPPASGPTEAVRITDWNRASALLRFVDLRDASVPVPPELALPEGGEVLVRGVGPDGATRPLLTHEERPEGPVWRFAFHPGRSELTLRPAFPTLVTNLLSVVRGEGRLSLGATLPEGATRDGEAVEHALRPGAYQVNGETRHASLLAEGETRLPTLQPADATPSERAAAEADGALQDHPLAPYLWGLALAALAAEWWAWSGGRRSATEVHSG